MRLKYLIPHQGRKRSQCSGIDCLIYSFEIFTSNYIDGTIVLYLCIRIIAMQEIIFVINESPEGGFEAEALGHSIFTEGETWAELKEIIIEAVACHFDDNVQRIVRMYFVKDELLTA